MTSTSSLQLSHAECDVSQQQGKHTASLPDRHEKIVPILKLGLVAVVEAADVSDNSQVMTSS